MTRIGDHNRLRGLAGARSNLLDVLHNIQSLDNLTEHDVLPVEPLSLGSADEELRSVGSGTGVCHGQDSWTGVLLDEVLVSELGTVDRFSSGAVPGGEVTSLTHEVRDHTVKGGSLEVERLATTTDSFLASAESTEILSGSGGDIGIKLEDDASSGLAADGHVEENLRVCHGLGLEKRLNHNNGERVRVWDNGSDERRYL